MVWRDLGLKPGHLDHWQTHPNASSFVLCLEWFWSAQARAISSSHFSSSNIFSIASATIKLWCSTVPLLNGFSAVVLCFNIQFFIHLSVALIIKFSPIVTQKPFGSFKIWYSHEKYVVNNFFTLLIGPGSRVPGRCFN